MNSEYTLTAKRLCFLFASFVLLTIQTADSLESSSNKQKSVSQVALDENREKRNAEIDLPPDGDSQNIEASKRYIPYEELQKRLRHFIGKRADDDTDLDNLGPDEEKRMRYFLGKRSDDAQTDIDQDLEKRMRYFVGKRPSNLRYFLGKRDSDEINPLADNDLQKRMRYFVGKRRYFLGKRRYFIGKRDDTDDNEDSVEKRLRYFVGKRPADDFVNNNAFHKRMRYFVGKRSDGEETGEPMDKRMRYFLGKRDSDNEQYEKRMRYFVG